MLGPREEFLCWDDTWMSVVKVFSERSKDPNTQVGACIVSRDNRIISLGYNGFPRNCDNKKLPWDRDGDTLNTKYIYVCHAESNAIDNATDNKILFGAKLYTTLYPCAECAKRIIQNNITEVIYLSDKYHDTDSCAAARKMSQMAKVGTRKFQCHREEILINLKN